MSDMQAWIDDMAEKPLPGGVAAAAAAAAMGAALSCKSARLIVRKSALDVPSRARIEAAARLAQEARRDLLALADADARAYRAVLDTRALAAHDPARVQARQDAVEVPLRVAHTCAPILDHARALVPLAGPAVRADLQIGAWLLDVGRRAGLEAALANVDEWGDEAEVRALRSRVQSLLEEVR